MAPLSSFTQLSEEIDQLLEHYLALLDQYTSLRAELSTLQSSVHQHIARANFSAERGVRYGPDFYDARMQATRVCRITVPSLDTFTTVAAEARHGCQTLDDVERDTAAVAPALALGKVDLGTPCFTLSMVEDVADEGSETKKPRNPLRMFGLLTPQALKLAQGESVKTVEVLVPRLADVDARMKEVEIRIRRARKWMAKAEEKERVVAGYQFEGTERREVVV